MTALLFVLNVLAVGIFLPFLAWYDNVFRIFAGIASALLTLLLLKEVDEEVRVGCVGCVGLDVLIAFVDWVRWWVWGVSVPGVVADVWLNVDLPAVCFLAFSIQPPYRCDAFTLASPRTRTHFSLCCL